MLYPYTGTCVYVTARMKTRAVLILTDEPGSIDTDRICWTVLILPTYFHTARIKTRAI